MSTVFDVTGIQVNGSAEVALGEAITTVTIQDSITIPTVTLEAPQTVSTLTVEVPGIQGPPGVKNVYVQPNDPSVEFNWGPEQAGYIWIEANV